MIPFRYVEFYDVPRVIAFTVGGRAFLLDSPFSEELDDYSPSYTVYEMPDGFVESDWGDEPLRTATRKIGSVPVDAIRFDETKRKQIDIFSLMIPPFLS